MGLPPVVTGVSPKEGPPGTRVTIRGENLGNSPEDIIGETFFPSLNTGLTEPANTGHELVVIVQT